jgi:clan AA aspartic protease (TIGR02281 family)
MKLVKSLSILLSISLGANFWFLYNAYQKAQLAQLQDNTENYRPENALSSSALSSNTLSSSALSTDSHAWTNTLAPNAQNAELGSPIQNSMGTTERSQPDYLAWLSSLAKAREFEQLEFEVGVYLRLYPQDVTALLLEAQAYYHNKPLNTALVHYHELLSKALTPEQQNEVEKLIAVNTTRIIQQFSGDGAWNLLAQFLEPLVQIAPANRQYLMGLARAYGMQSQLTLMEDTLANFPPNDARAIRLRNSINARLNQDNNDESVARAATDVGNEPVNNNRQADVVLQQVRGQFVTQAKLHNTSARFLVDTGASTTALSETVFNQIDVDKVEFLGLFTVSTAGGKIQAPIYKVEEITIGARRLQNTSVLILPSENLGRYDGLLGMNVLSQFDLSYDAATETMRLYKKRQSF